MPSPIIARADALMQRRRQSYTYLDDLPVLTDSIDTIDDIPVLTEIEPVQETQHFSEPVETTIESVDETPLPAISDGPSTADTDQRDELILELTSRIEDRIKAALPEIISSTIREFLAEQEMIENS